MLVLEVCRALPPSSLPQGLMLLAHVALTQEHLSRFPDRAFKHLAKVRAWVQGGVAHAVPPWSALARAAHGQRHTRRTCPSHPPHPFTLH